MEKNRTDHSENVRHGISIRRHNCQKCREDAFMILENSGGNGVLLKCTHLKEFQNGDGEQWWYIHDIFPSSQ